MTWRRGLAVVAVVAVAVAGYALAGESEQGSSRGKSRLSIVATDAGPYDVSLRAPAEVDAGLVEIELRNRGATPHDAQLIRVEGSQTATDVVRMLEAPDPDPKPRWMRTAGGVAPVAPGETATVTQVLQPGTYYAADTQEPTLPSGGNLVGAASGGIARIEVRGDDGGAELPATAATIVAREYGFDSNGISAGANRVTFRNAGRERHQVVAFRVADGVPFRVGARAVERRRRDTGWVPVDVPSERATTVLDGGGEQVTELTFAPGSYLLLCFVNDRAGGYPQWTYGMRGRLDVPSTTGDPGR